MITRFESRRDDILDSYGDFIIVCMSTVGTIFQKRISMNDRLQNMPSLWVLSEMQSLWDSGGAYRDKVLSEMPSLQDSTCERAGTRSVKNVKIGEKVSIERMRLPLLIKEMPVMKRSTMPVMKRSAMPVMKRSAFLIAIIALLLSISACEINRLRSAEELYNNNRYAAAIQELDDLIGSAKNGAIITRAEITRSNSYFALAEAAAQRSNWPLAIRFYKLANSDSANGRLAEIYRDLGGEAFKNGDTDSGKSYLDAITREAPESPLIPEVLYRRIGYFIEVKLDNEAAWADYMYLFDQFPDNAYEIQARKYVLRFIPGKIEYARLLNEQGYYSDALNVLFELSKYPVVEVDKLNLLISDVYEKQAEEYIVDQDYVEADRLFRIAMQYYPSKKQSITKRLEAITSLYVSKGNSLLEAGDFTNALIYYRKTFDIIPDYQPALDAIDRLLTRQENIKRAAALFAEGETLEATGKHAEALKAYNSAYALNALSEYRQRAIQVQNLVDAAKNPSAFAKRIIDDYKGGILLSRIRQKKAELLKRYKPSEINDSGWKILLSTGQYKYEARYDLLTPNETYLYVWQINLRERSVIPLNKLSEALLK